MTARSIRRAAERKAKKLAHKAERAAVPALASQPAPAVAFDEPIPTENVTPMPIDSEALEPKPITPAQLAANRANALLSTGPRTSAGLEKSSRNALKSGLTGRTVLLPTDDVAEYAAFLAELQADLKPVGQLESALVQIIVDCHWRLRRIQELEYALYTHGERQFEATFAHEPQSDRRSMIILQTHLTYQKELRNLHIQEARLDRKRRQAMAELRTLQEERESRETDGDETFADLDALFAPPLAKPQPATTKNGFDFSTALAAANHAASETREHPFADGKAA